MVYKYDNLESLKTFRDDDFHQSIPAWDKITSDQFNDIKWQNANSIQKLDQVKKLLGDRLSEEFFEDIKKGLEIAPMNIRMSPYVFALIDWDNPKDDPLRKQFLPVASDHVEDHPFCMLDSLHEDVDSPVPLLTHRYPDKVLFLPLTICPVYCAYCTRSRVIGGSTEVIQKETYGTNPKNWEKVFPKDRLLIVQSEEFFKDPEKIYHQVLDFLELPTHNLKIYRVVGRVNKNRKIEPKLLSKLTEYFRPHNEELYEYLGRRFDWDIPKDK